MIEYAASETLRSSMIVETNDSLMSGDSDMAAKSFARFDVLRFDVIQAIVEVLFNVMELPELRELLTFALPCMTRSCHACRVCSFQPFTYTTTHAGPNCFSCQVEQHAYRRQ